MAYSSAYERAATALGALQTFYDSRRGLWNSTGWWNAANAVTAILEYTLLTKDDSYCGVIANTFQRNRSGRFLNEFYDDEGWWALAWCRAYDVMGERRYLAAARTLFEDMRTGWDDVCGGGLWWNKERRYKNAITTELFLSVAAELHRRRHAEDELSWAQRAWEWFAQSGMINEDDLVNDGLDDECRNNGGITWTYNQGVILGGLRALYDITSDESHITTARAIADAAIRCLSNGDDIIVEPNESDLGKDGPQFKGIFVRNLRRLYDVTQEPRYAEVLRKNADSIWENCRTPEGFFGARWTGPFDLADAARQSSALDAINAAII